MRKCIPVALGLIVGGLMCPLVRGADTDEEGRSLTAAFGSKQQYGAWWTPSLPVPRERTQAVHVVLLPNGKVLIVSGSSNRNRIENGQVADGISPLDYDAVNNTALFDPAALGTETGWRRIESPPSPTKFVTSADAMKLVSSGSHGTNDSPPELANDLFCSGHVHLADGNVLFAGGSQNYYPGEKFLGSRMANVYDWKNEKWLEAGAMKDGHWYPSLLPLSDGRILVISGLSWDHFSNSSWVEFYDPSKPDGSRWNSVDIRTLRNSPFNTPVSTQNPLPKTTSHGGHEGAIAGLDELDHYPRIAPLPDGRFLITGDGSGGGNVNSKHTYLMRVEAANADAPISFDLGPERSGYRKTFGTGFMDPTGPLGTYLLIGGLAGSGDINIGPGNPSPDPTRINVVGSAERYSPSSSQKPLGGWSTFPQFLGDRPGDRRIMLDGVLLPTKQVLLMGGGTYGTSSPVFSPLLLTPNQQAPSGYKVTTMNPGQQPRLYHTSSLLLPDGRVFLAGGNATRAARDVKTTDVRVDTVRLPDGTYTFAEKGSNFISSEIYQIEIFYPPYLFISGSRPAITNAPPTLYYGQAAKITVTNATQGASVVLIKLGSMTHAWDMGQRLAELRFTASAGGGTAEVEVTAPDNRHMYPPGYYMLFYVNDKGKPSKAAMLQLN